MEMQRQDTRAGNSLLAPQAQRRSTPPAGDQALLPTFDYGESFVDAFVQSADSHGYPSGTRRATGRRSCMWRKTAQGLPRAQRTNGRADTFTAADFTGDFFDFAPTANAAILEDGRGAMVVDSSGALTSNNAIAHHDGPNTSMPPASNSDMATATLDAPALPALAAEGATISPSVTLDQSLPTSLPPLDAPNGLPTLDAPISFPHSDNMNGTGVDMPLDMPMNMAMDMAMEMDVNMGMPTDADLTAMDISGMPAVSMERLTAFARLRFDDGSYYMHTYQIILGRNIALAHRDMRRLAQHDKLQAAGDHSGAAAALTGDVPKKKKKKLRRGARSVISEKGGIVSAPIESMPLEYHQRRQSNASHSLSSASHPNGESGEEKPAERAPQDVLMQAFPEVPPQFDGHVPEDPNDCPLVPIHPQRITVSTGAQGPKGISREHAKIFYDFDNGCFCVSVLGNNGLYHQNTFLARGSTVPLDHGDQLTIGAVNVQFFLPDVALTDEQRQHQGNGSRPMSFSFENGEGELESNERMSSESEGEQSVNPRHVFHYPIDSESESEEVIDDDFDDYEEPAPRPRKKEPKSGIKLKLKPPYVLLMFLPCLKVIC